MIGYYLYKNKIFTKRFDLFEEIRRTKDPAPDVSLWFYDDVFVKYDWTKEPIEDIDTLYKQHAQWLRDNYDYLILLYSGGADSHNVLFSFIDNKIHLDEVCTIYPRALIRKDHTPTAKDLSLLDEHKNTTIPRLARLARINPEIKIRSVDFSDFIFRNYKNENFVEDNKEALSVSQAYYNGLREVFMVTDTANYVSDHIKGKVAIILGYDKPSYLSSHGRLITYFSDLARNPPLFSAYDLPYDPVMFYHHPNAAKILIKQGHMFKRAISMDRGLKKLFLGQTQHPDSLYTGQFYADNIKESVWMEKILYPRSFKDSYQQAVKFGDDDILRYHLGDMTIINEIWRDIKKAPFNIDSYKVRRLENARVVIKSRHYDLGPI